MFMAAMRMVSANCSLEVVDMLVSCSSDAIWVCWAIMSFVLMGELGS